MTKSFTSSEAAKSSSWLYPPAIKWPGACEVANLEAHTGADVILSGHDDPMTTMRKVSESLQAGATILVQLKLGNNLPSSISAEQLNDSLERMQAFLRSIGVAESRIPAMCCLQTTGYYLPRGDGSLWTGELKQSVDRPYIYADAYTHSHTNYLAVESALQSWGFRGGTVITPSCPTAKDLPAYLDRIEERLRKIVAEPFKTLYPMRETVEDILDLPVGLQQLARPLETVAFFMNAMKGIGEETAKRAADFYIVEQGLSVVEALIQMGSPAGNWFKGWSKTRQQQLSSVLCMNVRAKQAIDNQEEETP